jgi:hypothetical protein
MRLGRLWFCEPSIDRTRVYSYVVLYMHVLPIVSASIIGDEDEVKARDELGAEMIAHLPS